MRSLPAKARVYVGAVILAGAALLVVQGRHATFDQPVLFLSLLVLSSLTSWAAASVTMSASFNESAAL